MKDNYVGNKKSRAQLEKEAAFRRKWAPYKKLSIQKYADPMLEKIYATIELRKELYMEHQNTDESEFNFGQTKEVFLENFKELLDGNYMQVALTFKRIEAGEFVDDSLCTNGVWYDMKSYYEDLITANVEQVEGMEVLLSKNPNPKVEEKVTKIKRINSAMQRKIDANRFEQPKFETNTVKNPDIKRSEQAGSKKQQLNNKAKELAERIKALDE